jgi:hypothetical protein
MASRIPMTEAEWDRCTDPQAMLELLRWRASERKLRLFACACCRRIWTGLVDERSRRAVEVAERFADGLASDQERDAAADAAWKACSLLDHFNASDAVWDACRPAPDARFAAEAAEDEAAWAASTEKEQLSGVYIATPAGEAAAEAERGAQAVLLRDIFTPFRLPFLPVSVDPAWLAWHGAAVVKLARAVYEERELPSGHLDAARLAVLADMLEEAGCCDGELLGHLRRPGLHVRGCWVVDFLSGRE